MSSIDNVPDWDSILKGRYKVCSVEREIYLETQTKANNPEVYAKYICDGLKDGDVPQNLMKLYREAVYGSNKEVKERIMKRMYFLGSKTK